MDRRLAVAHLFAFFSSIRLSVFDRLAIMDDYSSETRVEREFFGWPAVLPF
jgi:hypothetical protein